MNLIRSLRTMAGLTQAALAARGGTSQPTVAAYETGKKSPRFATVQRLAESVGLVATVRYHPPMTREERRSLALHREIAAKLEAEPERTLALAQKNLSHSDAEQLVQAMLARDGLETIWTAGPAERGADILGEVQLPYGLNSRIAVQVKMHWDVDNDTTSVDQLELALREHSAHAGLLVTMASELGDKLKTRLERARRRRNIRVLYGDELYSRLAELVADSALEVPGSR